MATNRAELRRRVLLRLKDSSGIATIAINDALEDAQSIIAMVKDFDELMVTDSTSCDTVANQQDYVIPDNWALTRCKDIYSIKYMDEDQSRKLVYVPFRELDEKVPYPEQVGYGRPKWYSQRGTTISLFRIPDAAANVTVTHSQWPAPLSNDANTTQFVNLDNVIVALATDIARSVLVGGADVDFFKRAQGYLGVAKRDDDIRPDRFFIAKPFSVVTYPAGEYWLDPFYSGRD